MGTFLSSISGQLAKPVVFGTLFPVVIISILDMLLLPSLLPHSQEIQAHLNKVLVGDDKWGVVVLTFVVMVVTGLLYNLNIPIIQFYEGYPWKGSWIGKFLTSRNVNRLKEAQLLGSASDSLESAVNRAGQSDPSPASLSATLDQLAIFLDTQLPDAAEYVLPTRLGNVIRCFERYSMLAYGMDAIVLWPRLTSKIDPTFASTIDDAKSSFDFMLNSSFLSALTLVGMLGVSIWNPIPLKFAALLSWGWRAGIFLFLTLIFYVWAVNRAGAWGSQVRSAFDLYRLDLLKALGYQQRPLTFQEEKRIWLRISEELAYPDIRDVPLAYEQSPTRIIVTPPDIDLSIERRVGSQGPNLRISVQLVITNDDEDDPEKLRVIESIPDGYRYIPDSAIASIGSRLRVVRLTPLELDVSPPVAAKTAMRITYEMKPAQ
jgi:hypothetical protein